MDSLEADENPQPEEPDSANEADVEPEAEKECLWELNPLITSINKLDVNNTANNVGEWYINEELNLAYFSVFASDSVPSDTSTDVDDDPRSAIDILTSLHALVRSSLIAYQSVSDVQGPSLSSQQDAKIKNWSFLEESIPNQWFVKTLKARQKSISSLITSQIYSKW